MRYSLRLCVCTVWVCLFISQLFFLAGPELSLEVHSEISRLWDTDSPSDWQVPKLSPKPFAATTFRVLRGYFKGKVVMQQSQLSSPECPDALCCGFAASEAEQDPRLGLPES